MVVIHYQMTNTTVTVNVHNTSTEVLIIVSQTVFFVLLFLLLKNGLIDRRGMLSSKERIKDEIFQIMAIFFAIFVIIAIFMIPIESYEYAHYIFPVSYLVMILILGWEFYIVFYTDGVKKVRFKLSTPDIESNNQKPDLTEAGMMSFGTTTTKRPVNF